MKAIVTGGAGFIGSHLVDALVDRGDQVHVLDDMISGNEDYVNKLAMLIYCDISNEHQVNSVFGMIRPDVVFHQAASKCNACKDNPLRDLEVNAKGTLNLLRASVDVGVAKFIHASTGSVYGTSYNPTRDTIEQATIPLTYYGVSKLTGEKYVTMFAKRELLDTVVLRYFHVYGPRQRDAEGNGGVVGIFCRRALQGQPLQIFGDGHQVRCFTYVEDLVKANLWCSEFGTGYVYNCVSDERVTINQLAAMIAQRTDVEIEHIEPRPGEVRQFHLGKSQLPILWTSFDDGLEHTFNWYEERYGHSGTVSTH